MASLLSCAKVGMEKGWVDGWLRSQLGINTKEENRSWGKPNKDQIKEILWLVLLGSLINGEDLEIVL